MPEYKGVEGRKPLSPEAAMTDQPKTDAISIGGAIGEIVETCKEGRGLPSLSLCNEAQTEYRAREREFAALLSTIEAKDKRIAGLEGAIRSVLDHMRSHGATGTCFAGVVGDLESALTGTPSNLVVVDKQDYDILRSLAGVEADGYVTVERERLLQEPERSECSRDGESAES